MTNITTLEKNKCNGCSACYNVCPSNAITLQKNNEGFLYPQIDNDKCTNCGLCVKSCSALNTKYLNNSKPNCYAYKAPDKIRLNSASGGAFTTLAEHFIQNGGYVCGAIWDSDWSVKHIVSNKIQDLEKMKNSKYIQSDLKQCYSEIKTLLKNDKKVLFSGTPCQIAGLKSFLNKNFNNLFCIEILCHGVPSPKVFQKYLQENYNVKEIKNINLRSKHLIGCRPSHVELTLNNSKKYIHAHNDIFYKAFLSDISLRKSCYSCQFNKLPRQGDITIGDFWGIERFNKKIDDKKGVSLILENNHTAKTLIQILQNNSYFIKKTPLKVAFKMNPNIRTATKEHKNRDLFFKYLDKYSLNDTLDYTLNDKADCMIINYWFAENYGAILTCYGLQCLLEKLNKKTKVINYIPSNFKHDENNFCYKFANKYLNLTNPCKDYNDLLNLNKYCNTFITGSDQVFNHNIMKGLSGNSSQYIYLLDFIKSYNKKISFSASTGEFYKNYNNEKQLYLNHYLQQFDNLSVREFEAQQILKNEFNLNSDVILDPVFNIPLETLNKMSYKYDNKYNEKYIAYYGLQYWENSWELEFAKEISKKLNLPLKIMNFDKHIEVEEWLSFIKNSEFFISNSYHAITFSIIFNRPFVQSINHSSQERFNSLFKILNLKNNSVSKFDIVNWNNVLIERDWNKTNSIIQHEILRNSKWIENAINKEKTQIKNVDIINYHIAKDIIDAKENLINNKDQIYFNYYICKILSKILFGKTRKYYKKKRLKIKEKIRELRSING